MKTAPSKITRHSAVVFIVRLAVACNVLLVLAAVFSSRGDAMPVLSHHWKGAVVAVDLKAHTVEVTSSDRKKTIVLIVDPSRTRMARDGHRSALSDLHPGDAIVAYYKHHYSGWIATEVTATSQR